MDHHHYFFLSLCIIFVLVYVLILMFCKSLRIRASGNIYCLYITFTLRM